ncbi:hypothetical protein V8F20_006419 [Naviculisporaceae sp. PSN 640]
MLRLVLIVSLIECCYGHLFRDYSPQLLPGPTPTIKIPAGPIIIGVRVFVARNPSGPIWKSRIWTFGLDSNADEACVIEATAVIKAM